MIDHFLYYWQSKPSLYVTFSAAATATLVGKVLGYVLVNLSCCISIYPITFCFVFSNQQTPEDGASTVLYAAVSPELEGVGGCYLHNEQRTKSVDISFDEELQRRLWTESCKLVGIPDMAL